MAHWHFGAYKATVTADLPADLAHYERPVIHIRVNRESYISLSIAEAEALGERLIALAVKAMELV